MIGFFFREDKTQVVYAKVDKRHVQIMDCNSLPAVLADLHQGNFQTVTMLFQDVSKHIGIGYEDVCISLPDSLFTMDCKSYNNQDNEKVYIEMLAQLLHIDAKDYEVRIPFIRPIPRTESRFLTGCALKKTIVNGIVEAAKAANIALALIEPASFSYLRLLNDWEREWIILEVFNKEASIVSYSPIAGAFHVSLPKLAWQQAGELDSSNLNEVFRQAIVVCDMNAEKTFGISNVGVSIHVISPFEKKIWDIPFMQQRMVSYQNKEKMPLFLNHDFLNHDLPLEKFLLYSVPLGALCFPLGRLM